MAVTPELRPATATGVLGCEVLLSPSWPWALLPQHCTAPVLKRAQVWALPTAMPATPELRPNTATGVLRLTEVVSPSWPWALLPQHCTAPVLKRAQVWALPTAMPATPELKPETATGVLRFVVLPSPSWPSKLRPQHCTAPVLKRAQV
jgi:hypothetical protein